MIWKRNSIGDWQAIGEYGDFLVWRDGGAWKGRYRSTDHKTHFFLPRGKLAEVKKSVRKKSVLGEMTDDSKKID